MEEELIDLQFILEFRKVNKDERIITREQIERRKENQEREFEYDMI